MEKISRNQNGFRCRKQRPAIRCHAKELLYIQVFCLSKQPRNHTCVECEHVFIYQIQRLQENYAKFFLTFSVFVLTCDHREKLGIQRSDFSKQNFRKRRTWLIGIIGSMKKSRSTREGAVRSAWERWRWEIEEASRSLVLVGEKFVADSGHIVRSGAKRAV